jgi:hypothetical protein
MVPLLPGGVLGLDDLVVDPDAPGGELDPNGRFGLEVELVAREPRERLDLPTSESPMSTTLKR